LLTGIAVFEVTRAVRLKAMQFRRTPLTALMTEENYPPGWARADYVGYAVRAVRSDGSEVTVLRKEAPDGRPVDMKVILDIPSRRRVSVDPSTQSMSSFPLPERHVATYLSKPVMDCMEKPGAEHTTLLGYDALKTREPGGPPESQDLIETWMAPALGCFPLREEYTYPAATLGGGALRVVKQAVFVIPGEPSASLYEIPSTYTERSPGEVNAEFERRFPGRHAFPEKTVRILDQRYADARQQRP